jgi:hypothetical protein
MTGYIYIAGSFLNVNRSACGQGGEWIDNDPHFWTNPPTWGICRPDLREKAADGDVIFFVLPADAREPQMIFGYLLIKKKVTHVQAYRTPELRSKRMGNKIPNGNIIVGERGAYNRFDAGAHRKGFDRIKQNYAVGDPNCSKFLTVTEIRRGAPMFLNALSSILHKPGRRVIDIVSRYGSTLSESQTAELIAWLGAR